MKHIFLILLAALLAKGCEKPDRSTNFNDLSKNSPSLTGKQEYIQSPYVTAGDRVYVVGHQDGSFPPMGWHIKDEMGGIWNHPIKLMDGFQIELILLEDTIKLALATKFTNYPFATKHDYDIPEKKIEIERWQFVPDGKQGTVVQLHIKNLGAERKIKLNFKSVSDLRPTWLGERTDMFDGKDMGHYDKENDVWVIKDSLNPWYTVVGSELGYKSPSTSVSTPSADNRSLTTIEDDLMLFSDRTHIVNYTIAGSYISEQDAMASYYSIKNNIATDFLSKKERYQQLSNQTKLTSPDPNINEAFEWIKYNCDWLVRTVPEIGSGIGAGIPDYPWWFGVDSEYALQGYMAIGQEEAVYNTIRLLDSVSEAINGNGRIIHEMSTNGAVFNPGNINETPQFTSLIWKIYQWNGDLDFLKKYYPTAKKGMEWLLEENDENNNLFPDGYGMMEVHGMDSEMIDVASYTQRAFTDLAKIAQTLGDDAVVEHYTELAKLLKDRINTEFWNEEYGSYADFIGTDEQALHLIEDAIVRADTLNKPWAVEELATTKQDILSNPSAKPRPFVMHHNWVVNTPMETGIATSEKAKRALKTAENFVNPFGVFVTGIDRDESAGSDDGSFKGSEVFSYTGAVMTLPTGVQIVAENNYGNPDRALNYLQRLTRSFSYALPGSMYEVSPDYGMMTQAWNIYGYAVPIVEQFFGIQPDAANKKIVFKPQMPSQWNEAKLENVAIGNNVVSVYFSKKDSTTRVQVTQLEPGWEISIQMPKTKHSSSSVVGNEIKSEESQDYYRVTSKQQKATLIVHQN